MVILRSLKGHFLRGSKTMKDDHGLCQLLSIFLILLFLKSTSKLQYSNMCGFAGSVWKKHVFINFLKESNQTLEIGIEALSIF